MNGWEPVPVALIRDDNLSLQARAVYQIIRHLIWKETRRNEPTMTATLGTLEDIAREAGSSATALKVYLKELRSRGWLTTTRARRGQPYTYTIYAERTEPDSGSAQRRNPAHSRARGTCSSDELPDAEGGAKAPPSGRARNIVFDTLAEETGENPAISGGKIGKAEQAIRAAEADAIEEHVREALAAQPELDEIPKARIDAWLAEKIRRRAARYREMRPEWTLTATALATHWLRIPTWEATGRRGGLTPEEIANLDLG